MGDLLIELGAKFGASPLDEPVAPEYPLLSRLSDLASDAVCRPSEVNRFLAEIMRVQTVAKGDETGIFT
jgi:hypothetical protein